MYCLDRSLCPGNALREIRGPPRPGETHPSNIRVGSGQTRDFQDSCFVDWVDSPFPDQEGFFRETPGSGIQTQETGKTHSGVSSEVERVTGVGSRQSIV